METVVSICLIIVGFVQFNDLRESFRSIVDQDNNWSSWKGFSFRQLGLDEWLVLELSSLAP